MNGESHKADDDREASKPYDIDVTCPSCHSFDCVRAGRQGINDFIRVLVGRGSHGSVVDASTGFI